LASRKRSINRALPPYIYYCYRNLIRQARQANDAKTTTLFLLDKLSGEVLNSFTGNIHREFAVRACFDSSDALVLSGSEDGSLVMWDLVSAKQVGRLVVSDRGSPVVAVAAHPDPESRGETMVVAGGHDGMLQVFQ
jgi:mitogen-activated protein kinase organizer 1